MTEHTAEQQAEETTEEWLPCGAMAVTGSNRLVLCGRPAGHQRFDHDGGHRGYYAVGRAPAVFEDLPDGWH